MSGPSRPARFLSVFLLLLAADLFLLGPALWRSDLLRAPGDIIAASSPFDREAETPPPAVANPYLGDWSYSIQGWQHQVGEAWRAGRLPLWNDRAGCGQPLVGNMQAEVFSPYQPINVLAGDQYVDWKQLAQLLVAQLAALLLARVLGLSAPAAFVVALGYSFGSYMQCWMVHPVAGSAAFAPAIVACFILLRRGFSYRRLAGAAATIGLSILAGHVESSFMACFAASAVGFLLGRDGETGAAMVIGRLRFALLAIAAGALGVALAAPCLLPFFDYYEQSPVAIMRQLQPARSVPIEHLLGLLDPKALGFPVDPGGFRGFENYITTIVHPGRGVLLLAVIGIVLGLFRRRRGTLPLLAISAFGLALSIMPAAYQDRLDVFPLNVMPLLRLHYLAALLLPALAGIGLDLLLRSGRGGAILVGGTALLLAGLGPLLLATRADWSYAPTFETLGPGLLIVLGGLLAGAGLRPRGRLALLCLGLAALIATGDALRIWRPFVPTVATATLRPASAALDFLAAQDGPGRLLPVVPVLPPETAGARGLASLRHYDGMSMTRLTELLYRAGAYQGVITDAPIVACAPGLLDAMGIRWTLTDHDPARAVGRLMESFVGPGQSGDRDFLSVAGEDREFVVFSPERQPIAPGAVVFEVRDEEGHELRHALLDENVASDPVLGGFHRRPDAALGAWLDRAQRIQGSPNHYVAFRMAEDGRRLNLRVTTAADAPRLVLRVLTRDALGADRRFEHRGIHVGERRDALPFLHVSPRQLAVADAAAATALALRPIFEPRVATVVECDASFLAGVQPEDEARALAFERPRAEEIRFRCDFEHPTIVVLAEVAARGWEARSDGNRLPIAAANVVGMAIRVPAGAREVVLRYRSRSLAWGLIVAGVVLLLLLGSPIADRIGRGKPGTRDEGEGSSATENGRRPGGDASPS